MTKRKIRIRSHGSLKRLRRAKIRPQKKPKTAIIMIQRRLRLDRYRISVVIAQRHDLPLFQTRHMRQRLGGPSPILRAFGRKVCLGLHTAFVHKISGHDLWRLPPQLRQHRGVDVWAAIGRNHALGHIAAHPFKTGKAVFRRS